MITGYPPVRAIFGDNFTVMKLFSTYTGIGLMSLFLILTGFRSDKTPAQPISSRAVVAVIIENHSATKTIWAATVGPYGYTSLSIAPHTSQTFYEIDFHGTITVSVSCSAAWIGTIQYAEDDEGNTIGCNTTGTGSTHSLTCTANYAVKHIVQIFDTTYQCL